MPFLDDLQFGYGDIIEPLFCLLYAYLIACMIRSKNVSFHSQFYLFSVATGVAAISNVLLNYAMRIMDVRTRAFPDRGIVCNLDSWLSHIFSLSLTLGKTLTVTTRFTSICMPIKERNIWTPRVTYSLLTGMFLLPFLLYAFFPFQSPAFASTPDGYGRYLGIAGDGYKVAKAIGAAGYVLFFVTTVPMCGMAVMKLRTARKVGNVEVISPDSRSIPKYERNLLIYALILTSTHMLKSALQIIWFIALCSNATQLQTDLLNYYMLPNTLSSFGEPLLLIFTSSHVRTELWPCKKGRTRNKSMHLSSHPFTQSTTTRVS